MVRLLLGTFLLTLSLFAAQKRYTVGPMFNRFESLGKGLLEDDTGYGFRFGYNFDEHLAGELSYDYMSNFTLADTPGHYTTNGHRVMANFLYNVKDDEGFVPYMVFGIGAEIFDNPRGSLKSGAVGSFGFGAHFLVVEPFSLRFEVRDIVRLSDIGHTFSWTFGVEYAFGKMERYSSKDISPFSTILPPEPPLQEPTNVKKKEAFKVESEYKKRVEYLQRHIDERERKLRQKSEVKRKRVDLQPSVAASVASAAIAQKSTPVPAAKKKNVSVKVEVERKERTPSSSALLVTKKIPEPVKESVIAIVEPKEVAASTADSSNRSTTQKTTKVSAEKRETILDQRKSVETHAGERAAFTQKAPSVPKKAQTYKQSPTPKERCTIDSDKDGLNDCVDRCPKTPGGWKVDGTGCAVAVEMLVNFEFDSARLNERGRERVGMLAAYLERYPDVKVVIEGHTDSIGSDSYNIELSKKRALEVKFRLEDLGIESGRVKIAYYGESRPIATNETKVGRAKNRRADALFIRLK